MPSRRASPMDAWLGRVIRPMKSLGQLLDGTDVAAVRGSLETEVSDICYDSRKAGKGCLFVCVRGTKVDGHAFMMDAAAKGAAAILAESDGPSDLGAAFVRVPDSRRALAVVSANFYGHPADKLRMIGVTGTNGKTTTTLLLESILKHAGCSPGVLGTLGYRWAGADNPAPMTTPESLDLQRMLFEMAASGVTHAVMEVSSHALSMGRVEGCRFAAVVFTNLSQDHLDFHETMEEYFAAKKLLFSNYLAPGAGISVINADDPFGSRLIENGSAGQWSYSAGGARAKIRAVKAAFSPEGIFCTIETPRGPLLIESPLIGRLNLYNLLAAVATALALEIPEHAIQEGIRALDSVDGRLQRVPVPASCGFEVVVDYAHTPDAMEKALSCLREMTPAGRLIAVFGCGGDRDRGKRPLMGKIGARLADVLVITSDNPRSEPPERIIEAIAAGVAQVGIPRFDAAQGVLAQACYTVEIGRRKAIELALGLAKPGDVVFIGGKGHETYQIIGGKTYPFDDRLVVLDYFKKYPAGKGRPI